MSVYVTNFDTWEVLHDDARGGAHGGIIDPSSIRHTRDVDGTDNEKFLTVECPICGDISTHPVGGGSQPPLVQELFVRFAETNGCPCKNPIEPEVTGLMGGQSEEHRQHIKQHCEELDGPDRWQLD